jgi:hypothetical protein
MEAGIFYGGSGVTVQCITWWVFGGEDNFDKLIFNSRQSHNSSARVFDENLRIIFSRFQILSVSSFVPHHTHNLYSVRIVNFLACIRVLLDDKLEN